MTSETSPGAKPRLNIGAIGPAGAGKTALTAAILKVQAKSRLAEAVAYDDFANEESPSFEYETQGRHYTHVDCDGSSDAVAELVANIAQMDGAILVVAVSDGVMAQTREHVLFARQLGLDNLVVFLNKCDAVDDDVLDMVEMEVRDLLGKEKYNGDRVAVIRGAARPALDGESKWEAAIDKLLSALDESIPEPVRDLEKPFLMTVEDASDGVATGRIVRGVVRVGDEVEVVGAKGARKAVVTGIERFGATQDRGQAGDSVDCTLRGATIESGEVLAHPGSIAARVKFDGAVHTLKREEGGNPAPITANDRVQFSVRSASVMGTVKLPDGVMMVMPGDDSTLTIELDTPVALEETMRFALLEAEDDDDDDDDDPKVVGVGVVSRIVG